MNEWMEQHDIAKQYKLFDIFRKYLSQKENIKVKPQVI